MTEPITAWRYWWVTRPVDATFRFGEVECLLRGDMQLWEGPLKVAGNHRRNPFAGPNMAAILGPATTEGHEPVVHDSPEAGCLCGVNAVRRLRSGDLAARVSTKQFGHDNHGVAFAQVSLGGRVDEYEAGYRAQQALISGPIYVVVAPPHDPWTDWRSALERRYGQPVIEQHPLEALDWIRKDEEKNGHRRTHQDPPAGATTSAGPLTFGTGARQGTIRAVGTGPRPDPVMDAWVATRNDSLDAARRAFTAVATARFADDFPGRARAEERARSRARAGARVRSIARDTVRALDRLLAAAGWALAVGWLLDLVNFAWVP